ncbi:MAG TPA: GIY-YIG nuclease family protein [Bryobacteraceae bacterium]|jgi:predicted GIY-YIG superfamily endonuclease|nr:GIY-YIG nuclease family protein [Bryobacteraceae bacterium]
MVESDIPAPDSLGNTIPPKTYVYAISDGGGAVKVGVANNVQRRLKELQTGHCRKLSTFCEIGFSSRVEAYSIECRAHRLLKGNLLEGEWFSIPPETAREAIGQAVADLRAEPRLEAERLKNMRAAYKPPLIVEATGREADEFTAFYIAEQVAPEKKEVVVIFDDRAIFVGRGANGMCIVNDVTRWYMQDAAA